MEQNLPQRHMSTATTIEGVTGSRHYRSLVCVPPVEPRFKHTVRRACGPALPLPVTVHEQASFLLFWGPCLSMPCFSHFPILHFPPACFPSAGPLSFIMFISTSIQPRDGWPFHSTQCPGSIYLGDIPGTCLLSQPCSHSADCFVFIYHLCFLLSLPHLPLRLV